MKDTVFFCPACGSPSLEVSGLEGGDCACKACLWTGSREELAVVPIEHDALSQEELVIKFVNSLAMTFAKSTASEVGRLLLQWGFLREESLNEDLSAYMKSMAVAAARSVLETRQFLERVRVNKLRAKNAS